jgi:hypothetical protein
MAAQEITRRRVSIAGHVTDAVSGSAVAGAVVGIKTRGIEAMTDARGLYVFTDLHTGKYTLTVNAPRLGTRYGSVKISNVSVQKTPEGRPALDDKANIALPPTRVAGTITRSGDAQPVKGAIVRICGSKTKTVTDGSGKYAIAHLQAGTPTIEVVATGYAPSVKKARLAAGAETIVDFSLA